MSMNPKDLIDHVVTQSKRWGNMYTGDDLNRMDVVNAIKDLSEGLVHAEAVPVVPKEDLTKANRQLAAANARAGKLQKRLDKCEAEKKDPIGG